MRKDIPAHHRALLPTAAAGPTHQWERIPQSDVYEAGKHYDIFAVYVRETTDAELASKGRPNWFNFRWALYSYGALLGEGFSEDEREAMRMADHALDNAQWTVRNLFRAMDIRATDGRVEGAKVLRQWHDSRGV